MRYVAAILMLIFLGSLLTAVTQVRPGERIVVRRFGKVVATPGPGLFIGLPLSFDRVDRIPVDLVRRLPVGYEPEDEDYGRSVPGQFLTGDDNLVNLQVLVHYTVDNNELVHFMEHAERVDALLTRAAESVLSAWVAGRDIDTVLVTGKVMLPAVVVSGAQQLIEPYCLGIRLVDADVSYLGPPREVKSAFDDVNRAQALIETQKQSALQDSARKRREAETQKFQIEHETDAYVHEKRRAAHAEAARFTTRLEQYRRAKIDNPDALAAIWWDEMGQVFRGMKAGGRIDLLDHHLGKDGLDITVMPGMPRSK